MQGRIKYIFRKGLFAIILSVGFLFTFNNCPGQKSTQIIVVTFGNSTTAPRKNIEKVYAVRIEEDLKEKGIDVKVINAGTPSSHSGSIRDNNFAKIAHGMDRFDTGVLKYKPDWVTINFGLNDSWQDKGSKSPSRISVKDYRRNLNFYITKIQEIKGSVILLTPNPVGKKFNGYHKKRLKKYRRAVRELAKEKNVAVIDTWKVFQKYVRKNHLGIDSLLLDGIHPGDTGHELIANEIVQIITGFVDSEPNISGGLWKRKTISNVGIVTYPYP